MRIEKNHWAQKNLTTNGFLLGVLCYPQGLKAFAIKKPGSEDVFAYSSGSDRCYRWLNKLIALVTPWDAMASTASAALPAASAAVCASSGRYGLST